MSTNTQGKLPDFLVIGAMKAGTTSLHSYVGLHPEIFTSELKEINFFSIEDRYRQGIQWYKEHFISDKRIKGESSQSYTKGNKFHGVPKRIYAVLPKVKLIYILRDPVERILSHYYESIMQGYDSTIDFISLITNNPNNYWVKTSSYYWQLEKYLEYFNEVQILIITSEELRNSKLETLNRVFSFLGAEAIIEGSIFDYVKNTRSEKKMLRPFFNSILRGGKRSFIPDVVKSQIVKSKFTQRFIWKDINEIQFSEQDKNMLREILSPDVEKLKKFTGNNFSAWSL